MLPLSFSEKDNIIRDIIALGEACEFFHRCVLEDRRFRVDSIHQVLVSFKSYMCAERLVFRRPFYELSLHRRLEVCRKSRRLLDRRDAAGEFFSASVIINSHCVG